MRTLKTKSDHDHCRNESEKMDGFNCEIKYQDAQLFNQLNTKILHRTCFK